MNPTWRAGICAALLIILHPLAARSQCCGDCDGDGVVRIDELVAAVATALDACPADAVAVLTEATEIAHLDSRLSRPIRRGRIELTFTTPPGSDSDIPLVDLGMPFEFANRVQLLKAGEFLHFAATESSGRQVTVSVRIAGLGTGPHRIVTAWDTTAMTLMINDQIVGQSSLDATVELAAGTLLELGAAQSETYLRDVRFTGGS